MLSAIGASFSPNSCKASLSGPKLSPASFSLSLTWPKASWNLEPHSEKSTPKKFSIASFALVTASLISSQYLIARMITATMAKITRTTLPPGPNKAPIIPEPPFNALENLPNFSTASPTAWVILPITVIAGPAATTMAANFPIIPLVSSSNLCHHSMASFTLSTMLLNAVPIFSPTSSAHAPTSSDLSRAKNSDMDSFDCSKTPPNRSSPILPILALTFLNIPSKVSAWAVDIPPAKPSMTFKNSSAVTSPFETNSLIAS